MVVIDRQTPTDLFAYMSQNNLERQFSLLADLVHLGQKKLLVKVDPATISALHAAATTCLVDSPGRYREDHVHITGSSHVPCDPSDVPMHMSALSNYLFEHWEAANTYMLAAYALWRLVWIHPFEDGNGRTARALCYLVICLKEQTLLFGSNSYSNLIRENADAYMRHIRHADRTCADGESDVGPLAEFLADVVERQLGS
jgi:Fic family protein